MTKEFSITRPPEIDLSAAKKKSIPIDKLDPGSPIPAPFRVQENKSTEIIQTQMSEDAASRASKLLSSQARRVEPAVDNIF